MEADVAMAPEVETKPQPWEPSLEQLRVALAEQEFFLVYQPKLSCTTGRIVGVEALLRWRHADSIVPPDRFIPMLERSGLIIEVGAWALGEACRQGQAWVAAGIGEITVAVNLSGRQLQSPDIFPMVADALAESGLAPRLLELELTESFLMEDHQAAVATLSRLKSLGLKVSVDDFGTGYSSLAYLRRMPMDCLKIDRAFVREITDDPNDASITRAIIDLAHNLKLYVVAEGVETEAQLGMLISNHCDAIQGYYFSPPVQAERIAEMLRADSGLPSHVIRGNKGLRTLLLVDDEENILSSLKRMLRRANYRVLTATSATEGLKILAENAVDVVISDQRMPVMTGVEFLRRVKDIHPDTVRMVLSGYTDLQSVTDAINEGAIYKFLTKPWDDEHLLANIEEAFRRKEMQDENLRLTRELSAMNSRLEMVNRELCSVLHEDAHQAERNESLLQVLQEVVHRLPVPVVGIDEDGLIAMSNQAANELLAGGTPLIGQEAVDCVPAALLAWLSEGGSGDRACTIGNAIHIASEHHLIAGRVSRGHLLTFRAAEAV